MRNLPRPYEIGLPEKYDSWRLHQEPCISSLLDSPKRASVVNSPTGSGKTITVVSTALLSGKRTMILTANNGLLDQYMKEFESCGLVEIRGRANYQCEMREDFSCQEGRTARCPYWGSTQCPYSAAEMRVSTSKIAVSNYAKWLMTSKFDTPLANFEQLILDEGHEVGEALANSLQIVLQHHEIEEEMGVPFPDHHEADEFWNWRRWSRAALDTCNAKLAESARKLEEPQTKTAWVKKYLHYLNLQNRLNMIQSATPTDWVVDELPNVGYQFDPIRPARYAELKLFCKIPRIIIVSATIRPKTMYMLGVSKERFDFFEYPSDFDPSRCPTYHIPTLRNDHRCEDFSMLYLKADQIMGRRADRKGIIHTVSWKRLEEVTNCSRYSNRMLVNIKGESATEAIDEFKAAKPGTVLVSPSVGTGYDFPNDECEYQIILKVPFQDGRSKIVKARQADDPEYGPYKAMQTLVQTVGRGMRSKVDRCENFILDDHIEWFRKKFGHFAPATFHKFFRTTNSVPAPPPKL